MSVSVSKKHHLRQFMCVTIDSRDCVCVFDVRIFLQMKKKTFSNIVHLRYFFPLILLAVRCCKLVFELLR